jgi:hypothetical protein
VKARKCSGPIARQFRRGFRATHRRNPTRREKSSHAPLSWIPESRILTRSGLRPPLLLHFSFPARKVTAGRSNCVAGEWAGGKRSGAAESRPRRRDSAALFEQAA